jgi:hypothetical protein
VAITGGDASLNSPAAEPISPTGVSDRSIGRQRNREPAVPIALCPATSLATGRKGAP